MLPLPVSKSLPPVALAALCAIVPTGVATRDDGRLDVQIVLARAEVFVGEDPGLTITLTAPAGGAVRVVKSERAHLGYLVADLIGPDGLRVPGGWPQEFRPDEPDDFMWLDAGASSTIQSSILSEPPLAGEYRVNVTLRPISNNKHVLSKQFRLTSRPLMAADIITRTAADIPPGAVVDKVDPKVDLLVVKSGAGHTLFYRASRLGQPVYLRRLWPVSAAAKPITEVVGYDRGRVAGTIRVTYDEGGKPVVAEIGYWTGGVIKAPPPAVAPPPRPAMP